MTIQKNKKISQISYLPDRKVYSEHDLVRGLVTRDSKISAAFFDEYGEYINRLVWKILGPDDEHDDVVNTTLMQIMQSVKNLKDPQSLEKWVSVVTINTVRKEIRTRQNRRRLFKESEIMKNDLDVYTDVQGDITGRVYKILRTMKPENYIIFVLRYIEGNMFSEIAQLRNCSLATAKRQGKKSKEEFLKKARRDLVLAGFIEEKEQEDNENV